MLGQRIRELRLKLGLSQRQLAGTEMTRNFISLIESGRAMPSREMLGIIARRLGKTAEALEGEIKPSAEDATAALLEAAGNLAASGQEKSAMTLLEQVGRHHITTSVLIQAKCILITCLLNLGEYQRGLAECEELLKCPDLPKDRKRLVWTYLQMGACSFGLQNFSTARWAYEQAVSRTTGLKSMIDSHIEALTYLGTTLIRLGETEEAVEVYQQAIQQCSLQGLPERGGLISLGLGKAWYQMENLDEAEKVTLHAAQILAAHNSPDLVLAEHNLAIVRTARGAYKEAYEGFQKCLGIYEERGLVHKQASVLEDLATYWMKVENISEAKRCCRRALGLSEDGPDRVLRARLYRLMGSILADEGEYDQAYHFARMSYDLLQILKAGKEIELSRTLVRTLRAQVNLLA